MKRYVATSTVPSFGRPGARSYGFRPTQKTQAYDAILAAGKDGLDAKQVAQAIGLAVDRIRFYLSELRRAGFIMVLGDPTTVSPTMSADDAAFAAMLGLENALIAKAREKGTTPEMDRSFVMYTKFKERALAQPSPSSSRAQIEAQKNEVKIALRMAMIELVKLVF